MEPASWGGISGQVTSHNVMSGDQHVRALMPHSCASQLHAPINCPDSLACQVHLTKKRFRESRHNSCQHEHMILRGQRYSQGPTCCTSSLDSWRASASLRVSTVKALSTRSFSLDLARISPSSPVIWLDPPLLLPGAEGPPGMSEATPRDMRTSPPIEGAVKLFSSFRPASKYPAYDACSPCQACMTA